MLSSSSSSSLSSSHRHRSAFRNNAPWCVGGGGSRSSSTNVGGALYSSSSSACRASVADTTESITTTTTTTAHQKLQDAMDVTHAAYEVLEKDVVTEYGAYCTLYRHRKSGAQLLSVANADDNKVFGVTFRTPPADETGIAHILEHSVLCGSRKYTTKVCIYVCMYV